MGKIFFSSADRKINIVSRKGFKNLITKVFESEKKDFEEIRFIFCSDKYLLQINSKYLKHNYLTDVITFDLSEAGKPIISEVYLSVDRIKENAKSYFVSYENELLRVMIHGCLHICGYNDNTHISKKRIHTIEDYFLKLYSNFSRET